MSRRLEVDLELKKKIRKYSQMKDTWWYLREGQNKEIFVESGNSFQNIDKMKMGATVLRLQQFGYNNCFIATTLITTVSITTFDAVKCAKNLYHATNFKI